MDGDEAHEGMVVGYHGLEFFVELQRFSHWGIITVSFFLWLYSDFGRGGASVGRGVVKERRRVSGLRGCVSDHGSRFVTVCNEQHMNGAFLVGRVFRKHFAFQIANGSGISAGRRLAGFNFTLLRRVGISAVPGS